MQTVSLAIPIEVLTHIATGLALAFIVWILKKIPQEIAAAQGERARKTVQEALAPFRTEFEEHVKADAAAFQRIEHRHDRQEDMLRTLVERGA